MNELSAKEMKVRRRRTRVWRLLHPVAKYYTRTRCGFRGEGGEELAAIDGPLIVVINHANALDPGCIIAAFKRPVTFVASEHLLRSRPWGPLISRYVSLIPHKKGGTRSGTSDKCLEHLARGEAIYLAAEGEQSWDGRSGRAKPHTGSLIKRSGATLVTYRIEGNYLAKPRWAGNDRRGKTRGYPVHIYAPEEIARMSEEEIETALNRDLDFDVWAWQQAQPDGPIPFKTGRNAAVGLEKAVCVCPSCQRIGLLSTRGDEIRCTCGFSVKWSKTGFFVPDKPFKTIIDWEAYDRERIAAYLSGEGAWPEDEHVTLHLIGEEHTDRTVESGTLTLVNGSHPAMTIGGRRFELDAIERMAMILDKRIVFTADGSYYELKAEDMNLRKYMTAWEISQESI